MRVSFRRPSAWLGSGILMVVLAALLAACGSDAEVLSFPGPTPTASVQPEPTQGTD